MIVLIIYSSPHLYKNETWAKNNKYAKKKSGTRNKYSRLLKM